MFICIAHFSHTGSYGVYNVSNGFVYLLVFYIILHTLHTLTYSHVRLIFLEYGSHLRDIMDRQLKNSTAVTQEHIL